MAFTVTVPRLGWSMEQGTFVEWLKRDGDVVKPGDELFVLESDKAAENIAALDGGILHLLSGSPKPGDLVQVGQVLAYLTAEGEAIPSALPSSLESTRPISAREDAGPSPSDRSVTGRNDTPHRARPAVSPRARRVARELGIDWTTAQGTGRNGRIREMDVRALAADLLQGTLYRHTHIRRLIAARMVAGTTQTAPVTLTTKADATELVGLRERLKSASLPGEPPGFTVILVKLAALALRRHPLLQAQWREEGLFVPDGVHIGVAVDTDAGLLVPVLRDADHVPVQELADRLNELTARATAGRLSAAEMHGATFTVTNLGMFGIDAFTPIIHLPESAVLGVGRIVREPRFVGDHIVPGYTLVLSLTFDHRVVDGAPAARFLQTLSASIEAARESCLAME